MVQRILLALILSFIVTACLAQPDSLEVVSPDTLLTQSPQVDRALIEAQIVRQMNTRDLFRPFLRESSPQLSSLDLYRASYHAVGLDNALTASERHGFTTLPGIWSRAYILQHYDTFYEQSSRGSTLVYGEDDYTQPVMLTDLQAGLGDYEFNFARLGLKKNQLFGFPGLSYRLDFLAQTGLWTGIDHDQTSMRHYLSARLGKFLIETEYANWAVDASSQDLQPLWWKSSNFVIDHKLRQLYAALRNPWLDLSLLSTAERAKAGTVGLDQKNSSLQLKASKTLKVGKHSLSAEYEHLQTDLDYSPRNTSVSRIYDDLLKAVYGFSNADLNLQLEAELYDFEHLRLEGDSAWNWLGMTLGMRGMVSGLDPEPVSLIDIYNPALVITPVNQYLNAMASGYLSAHLSPALSIGLNAGLKQYHSPGTGPAWEDRTQLPFADMKAGLETSFGSYRLSAGQSVNWQGQAEPVPGGFEIAELPQWRYQTHIQLQRDMRNDNRLFGGLSYLGHSSYFSATQSGQEFSAAGIMDLWAGVQISKLFELKLSFKNVLDTDIYGVYPVPRSVHATLRWFYLN